MTMKLTDYLPPGFEVMEAGTGRKTDCKVAFRRVGDSMFGLVVSFGKESVKDVLQVDPTNPVYAVVGFNWHANQAALAILTNQQPPGALKAGFKEGALSFTLRPDRLKNYRLKQPAVDSHYSIESNPSRALRLVTVTLPAWVQSALAPDNSAEAARRRAADAAQAVRLRA